MADYKAMYLRLFNKITDVISLLQSAQAEAEDMYISQEAPGVIVLEPPNEEE